MVVLAFLSILFIFFFNDTATTEIYPLSLHDALPISPSFGEHLVRARVPRLEPGHARSHRWIARGRARSEARRAARCVRDRKSTRLNSSHQIISYAVFCLKKKNTFILIHLSTPLLTLC